MKEWHQFNRINLLYNGSHYEIPLYVTKKATKEIIAYTWYEGLYQLEKFIEKNTGISKREIFKRLLE